MTLVDPALELAPDAPSSGGVLAECPAPVHAARGWFALILLGGSLGIVSTTWQTVDRIAYADDSSRAQVCDINAVLSCRAVFGHWQSSALGIPNSLIGLAVFAVLASAGLAGLLGSTLAPRYLAGLLGLSAFMTGFVTWYMEQTAFRIGALCLFCAACMVNILLTSIGLTRVVAAEHALGDGRAGRTLQTLVAGKTDLSIWLSVGLLVAGMLFVELALGG